VAQGPLLQVWAVGGGALSTLFVQNEFATGTVGAVLRPQYTLRVLDPVPHETEHCPHCPDWYPYCAQLACVQPCEVGGVGPALAH
jgi:hypothetical protein